RMAVLEILEVSSKLAKLIEARAPESSLRQQAQQDGMRLLSEHAAEMVRTGITPAEEVLRVVDTAAPRDLCPHCQTPVESGFKASPVCAAPLKHECTNCSQPLQPTWKVCPFCRTPAPAFAGALQESLQVTAPPAAAAGSPAVSPQQPAVASAP